MITLKGQLANIFVTPKGKNKEGETYGGEDKLQILNKVTLQNDESRVDLISITVPDAHEYKELQGKQIELPIDIYVFKGSIGYRLAR